MKLVGMLDSPYVRRVAISMQLLRLRFEHVPLSVFSTPEAFKAYNPALRAPTLVTDAGTSLVDSGLILQYVQTLAPERPLLPASPRELAGCLRLTGLSVLACDKAVQLVHEQHLRPPEKRHTVLTERFWAQLSCAFDDIQAELLRRRRPIRGEILDQGDVTAAVAWTFVSHHFPAFAAADRYFSFAEHAATAESLAEFTSAPFGEGACRPV